MGGCRLEERCKLDQKPLDEGPRPRKDKVRCLLYMEGQCFWLQPGDGSSYGEKNPPLPCMKVSKRHVEDLTVTY